LLADAECDEELVEGIRNAWKSFVNNCLFLAGKGFPLKLLEPWSIGSFSERSLRDAFIEV